ncbi:MAG: nucleotidyl transferase AbiEii/AbiGii toxin family protein [Acidobacteriota bacterium]|nr:nucleotidyl transferase AbiEii/AbiGii toxin family protein [Acidobacteriota bacterium]
MPEPQRRVWDDLIQIPPDFVLYGGTAISVRLAHRESVDFDFFSALPFAPNDLLRSLPMLRDSAVKSARENTLLCSVERNGPVSMSFFGGLDLNRVEDPDQTAKNNLSVASLLDLAATKLKVLWDRATFKDYFDIDVLLQSGVDLSTALAAARAVYGPKFNPMISLKALSYFGDGDVFRLSRDAQERLLAATARVDAAHLPTITAKPGLTHS